MARSEVTEQAVIAEIKKFVVDLQPDFDNEIVPSSTFEEMGLDSLSQVDLLGRMEQEFGTYVPDSEIGKIKKVCDLVDVIARLSRQA